MTKLKLILFKVITLATFILSDSNFYAQKIVTVDIETYCKNCSDNPIYQKIIALKKLYPHGTRWTNENSYVWNGGIFTSGSGCAGFAFMLSDAAFGDNPARKHYDFHNLKIGDILRMNNDGHSVVIICLSDTNVTLVEGNFNSSVHWGRNFPLDEIRSKLTYVITRYPL